MFYTSNYNPSGNFQNIYDEEVAQLLDNSGALTCPHCAGQGTLVIHGYYIRYLYDADSTEIKPVKITRMRCKSCRVTHAVLPSAIVPRSQVPLKAQIKAVEIFESQAQKQEQKALEEGKKPRDIRFRTPSREILANVPCLTRLHLWRLIHKYLKQWRQRILSLHMTVCSEMPQDLVSACFRGYGYPFLMHIPFKPPDDPQIKIPGFPRLILLFKDPHKRKPSAS